MHSNDAARAAGLHHPWWNCTGERFTLIWNLADELLLRQRCTCRASLLEHPFPNADNQPAGLGNRDEHGRADGPRVGWFQRIRASALWMEPLASSTMGW